MDSLPSESTDRTGSVHYRHVRFVFRPQPKFEVQIIRHDILVTNLVSAFQRFMHRQRVHLPAVFIRAGFNRRLQKMASGLDGQRIGNHPAGPFLVLHPCWMRQRNPYRTSAGEKLYVYRVSVPGRNRDNQGLVNTVEFFSGPAVGGVKVLIHAV